MTGATQAAAQQAKSTAKRAAPKSVASSSSTPKALVFEGVTVVDVEQGRLLADQRVVVVGTRIRTVEAAGASRKQGAVPPGAQVVDARGKYLIPGLWDMHVHPFTWAPTLFYPLLLANGVTGFRNAWTSVPMATVLQWRQAIAEGTLVGPPRELVGGPSLVGISGKNEAEQTIDSLKAEGANFIKVYPFTPALAAASKRAGLPFGGHLHGTPIEEASDSGITFVDHINTSGGIAEHCWNDGFLGNAADCEPIAARMRRNNTWWVPTLFVHFENRAGDGSSRRIVSLRQKYDEMVRQFRADSVPRDNWLRRVPAAAGGPPATEDTPPGMAIMQQVGLPITAGTDLSQLAGYSLHVELAYYVAEGLTTLAALQTATLNPAKALRATDSLGTVAPGKLADLVLLDANPLADITNTTTVRAVVANGRYFDRAALDRLLAGARIAADSGKWWGN